GAAGGRARAARLARRLADGGRRRARRAVRPAVRAAQRSALPAPQRARGPWEQRRRPRARTAVRGGRRPAAARARRAGARRAREAHVRAADRLRETGRWIAWIRLAAVPFAVVNVSFAQDYPSGFQARGWAITAVFTVGAGALLWLSYRDRSRAAQLRLGL